MAEMVPGRGAWSTLRPGRGRCCVPGRGAAPQPGGQEGAHGVCRGGSPGGRGEGPSRLGLNCSHSSWLGCGIETFLWQEQNCWLWRLILFISSRRDGNIWQGRQHGQETQAWTAWGNAEPADPTWGRVRGQRSAHDLGRRFAAGLQLPCCLLQRLRLRPLQPQTKVFPVQPRVRPGTPAWTAGPWLR